MLLVFFREATSFPILNPEEGRKSTSNGLPRWLTYVCWLLLGVTSLVAAFFTALYSLELNKEQATSWVISMILSVLQNVFIIQPAKVCEQWAPPACKECVKLWGAWGAEVHGYWSKVPNDSDNLTKRESSPQKRKGEICMEYVWGGPRNMNRMGRLVEAQQEKIG